MKNYNSCIYLDINLSFVRLGLKNAKIYVNQNINQIQYDVSRCSLKVAENGEEFYDISKSSYTVAVNNSYTFC